MPLDKNYTNFLPHNEARHIVLSPDATGVDDMGNFAALEFIADLSISCNLNDDPYLSSINIGTDLISGIIMTGGTPILTFTALKADWHYGKPIFLRSLAAGYSGYITPGVLDTLCNPIVHRYSFAEQSRLAERCLFRFEYPITEITNATLPRGFKRLVNLQAGDGLTLTKNGNRIEFNLSDDQKLACANGINRFPQFQEDILHNVGCIGGACPDELGILNIIFNGPFVVAEIKDEDDITVGIEIGVDLSMDDLCGDSKPDSIVKSPSQKDNVCEDTECEALPPFVPECQPDVIPPSIPETPPVVVPTVPNKPEIAAPCRDTSLLPSIINGGRVQQPLPGFYCLRAGGGAGMPLTATISGGSISQANDGRYHAAPGVATLGCYAFSTAIPTERAVLQNITTEFYVNGAKTNAGAFEVRGNAQYTFQTVYTFNMVIHSARAGFTRQQTIRMSASTSFLVHQCTEGATPIFKFQQV